jgi:HK97 family phage portal protein
MPFWIFKNTPAQLSDLSDNDRRELFSIAEKTVLSRIPNTKERSFIEQRVGVTISKLADFQSYIDAGSKKVWASFRACHLVANVLVSAKVQAIQLGGENAEDQLLPETHPLAMFLSTPNPFDSWEELLYMWTFHMKLTGTAYWLKDEVNGAGQPKAIFPLLPQYVEADPDPKLKVKGWKYKVNGQTIAFKPEEILQFRRPHPNNLIMGMGDVEPSQDTLSAYINRNALDEKFLENGAMPSGILTKKEVIEDEGAWKAFRQKFNFEYGGKNNAGKTAFLNGDWSYHKLGLTMQEMQAIEREKWTVEQIFLIHGVPLSVAGINGAANYATARQDDINFRKYECVPLLDLLIGRINMAGGIAKAYGDNLRYDYSMSGLIDVEQTLKDYGPMVKLGAMTPNELREKAGLQRIDDPYLDQFFVESGLVPIAIAGMTGAGDPPQTL